MKKLVLAVLAVFVASAGFAGDWGLGLKLGLGQNDPKTLKEIHNFYGGELDEGDGVFGIEGQYEWLLEGENKLGVRFGFDIYGDNEVKVGINKMTEDTFAIPLTVYYKLDKGVKAVSCYGGVGATYMKTEVEEGTVKDSKSKIFPHIVAGAEYRFSELFALGVEAKYNISAKIEKETHGINYKTDRSGFIGALVGRFYF